MIEKASLKRLQLSNFKLEALLNVTLAINQNMSTDRLLKLYEKIIREDLNIGKVILYTFNNGWNIILSSGVTEETYSKIVPERELVPVLEITNLVNTENQNLSAFDVIIPVFHKHLPLAYVLLGDIDEERDGISPVIKHLHFFQTLSNVIVVAIENKRLYKEIIQQETLKKEMELASQVQTMLIPNPDSLPNNEHISFSAFYQPHFDVGGDYYDVFELSDIEYGFCIADVSGKGISAALIMSNFQASIRALFTNEMDISALLHRLNRIVMQTTNGDKFITLFVAKYNTKTRELIYVNAGHVPPILYNNVTKATTYLSMGCPGLGMLTEIPSINLGSVSIPAGSRLICFTDGLQEAENDKGVEFGNNEIEMCLRVEPEIDKVLWKIIQRVNAFRGRKSLFDDISLIGVKF
ncbi:MAG: serine/threonine protein phosphatase [Bacteroidetes bacterium HGW-Bacteroidetes-21]|nr:MAG: serine/threonine protein phosphatase [Bacteroidetes bacterium HGW-Bacteroidetes-21]